MSATRGIGSTRFSYATDKDGERVKVVETTAGVIVQRLRDDGLPHTDTDYWTVHATMLDAMMDRGLRELPLTCPNCDRPLVWDCGLWHCDDTDAGAGCGAWDASAVTA